MSRFDDFVENFGKAPDEPPPPTIPKPWRMPVFAGTAIVGTILLVLLLWLVVVPAIQSQSTTTPSSTHAPASTTNGK